MCVVLEIECMALSLQAVHSSTRYTQQYFLFVVLRLRVWYMLGLEERERS